jgi:S1-C subfamily serine protease
MTKQDLKKLTLYIFLGVFLAFSPLPGGAQTLSSLGIALDPGVLVSHSRSDNNSSRQNLDSTIVDIKAVDAPALHAENGKVGVGSEQRYGQGIIIDSAGIIATNRHIVGNAQHIYVRLSGGKIFEATVLRNSQTDLCLIKINAPVPLRAISLADPSEIQIGINVIAIANAGLNLQRKLGGQVIKIFKETSSNNVELLEMNIPLKPGDSGGPVLNVEGSLLGLIMGKKISDPGKSYAIASSRIQQEYFKYRNSILN